jgi:hypothetical protein
MGKASRSKRDRNARKSDKFRSPLSAQTLKGKELLPPFAKMTDKLAFSSWLNDRLPEMVWAALIRLYVDEDNAFRQFRRFLTFIGQHSNREQLSDVTLTGFSKLDDPLREELLAFLLESPEVGEALATLRLFESLPARPTWDKLLPQSEPNISLLMKAVGATLWHQSQEATDCRWVRLMAQVVTGKFEIPGISQSNGSATQTKATNARFGQVSEQLR